jgi:hypothetical protein
MKFKIYQIYNGKKMAMHMKHKMNFSDDIAYEATMALDFGYYSHVANIEATDLDNVFEIGNIGVRSEIEMIEGTKMHSISVGDIIQKEISNEKFVVADFGFKKITSEGMAV